MITKNKKRATLFKRITSLFLALLIVASHFPVQQAAAQQNDAFMDLPSHREIDLPGERPDFDSDEFTAIDFDSFDSITLDDLFVDPNRAASIQARREGLNALTQTFGTPLGAVGFEGNHVLPSDNQLVDVEIHFTTPSAVALRLLSENNVAIDPYVLSIADLEHGDFEAVALLAHETFQAQLDSLVVPFTTPRIDIFQSHHLYWNGVFASVAASSVETIAALPGVFAVAPVARFYAIGELMQAALESDEQTEEASDDVLAVETMSDAQLQTSFSSSSSMTNFFNQSILDQFEVERIRDELNLQGEGIQIAVLDTGVDWMHPQFENHRIPSTTSPTATDARFGFAQYTVRGWNHINDNPYPFEALPEDVSPFPGGGRGATSHGTHVAGTIQAIAPGATFYHYRVLHGSTPGNIITAGIERAILDGADVVNMSLGGDTTSPIDANTQMINVASLDGTLFVIAAGNSGPSATTVGTPGTASLALTVANGQLGGWTKQAFPEATVNGTFAPLQVHGWGPGIELTDSLAGLVDLDANGDAAFVWFGQVADVPEHPTRAWIDAHFPDIDLTGRIAVMNRGASPFTGMRAVAQGLNASALIIVNNQANDAVLDGTTVQSFLTDNQIPILSAVLSQAELFGGPLATIPAVPVEGVVNFGALGFLAPPPNILNTGSSRGPTPTVSHIKPDITGPGTNIHSSVPTFSQFPENPELWGNYADAYAITSGTSMASPAVAAIAALMIEKNPTFAPYEVKARIMNTAFPVGIEGSNYSVFEMGAGFIDPWRALTQDAFATVEHPIPWQEIGNFATQTMSSLSFGVVPVGTRTYSDEITIEVHGEGTWMPIVEFNTLQAGTQFVLVDQTETTFTYRFEFANNAVAGISDGNIMLTSGNQSIRLPFAVNHASVAAPVEVHPQIGIARPIVSNFVRTTAAELDPREISSNTLGAITPSNFSNALFGFADPNPQPSGRVVELYHVQYDEYGYMVRFWYFGAFNFPQGSPLLLTDFVSGIFRGEQLPEGIFSFYAFINDPWHPKEVEIGRFIVTDRRPEVTFNEEVFMFDDSMPFIPVEAQVYSWAHELAILEDIRTGAFIYNAGANAGEFLVFDYRFTFLEAHPSIQLPNVNSQGMARFNIETPANSLDFVTPGEFAAFFVIDGDTNDVAQNIGGNQFALVGAHVSLPTPLYLQYEATVPSFASDQILTPNYNQTYEWRVDIYGTRPLTAVEVTAGALPVGLTIEIVDGEVLITGTPTQRGEFTFTLTVTNTVGTSVPQTFTGEVVEAVGIRFIYGELLNFQFTEMQLPSPIIRPIEYVEINFPYLIETGAFPVWPVPGLFFPPGLSWGFSMNEETPPPMGPPISWLAGNMTITDLLENAGHSVENPGVVRIPIYEGNHPLSRYGALEWMHGQWWFNISIAAGPGNPPIVVYATPFQIEIETLPAGGIAFEYVNFPEVFYADGLGRNNFQIRVHPLVEEYDTIAFWWSRNGRPIGYMFNEGYFFLVNNPSGDPYLAVRDIPLLDSTHPINEQGEFYLHVWVQQDGVWTFGDRSSILDFRSGANDNVYRADQYTVSIDVEGNGTVQTESDFHEGLPTTFVGTEITLTAVANFGDEFISWTVDGEVVSTDEDFTFVVEGDKEVVANFSSETEPTCPVITAGSFAGATGSEWRICYDGTLEIDEGVINWTNALSPWHNHRGLITQIEITGPITAGASLRALFRELTEVTTIEGLAYFDTAATTSMYRMFFGLSGVTELDVTNFATNHVTNMALMFRDASSLVELDVSNFDTSNVVDMREMFRGTSIETLDLGNFDTGNVTNMNQMFTALHTLRELTLGESFNFIGTPNLVPLRQTEEFTGLWQGANVVLTSAQLMAQFDGSTMAGTFIRQAWTEKDPEICYIEARGRFANGATIGGAQWHLCDDGTLEVGSGFINWTLVTSPWHAIREEITEIVFTGEVLAGPSLRSLFHDLENLAEIHNLSYLDTSQTTNMARMFRGASSLTDLDLSSFDTTNVTDMSWMFFGASGLEFLDVTNFATNDVTNMALMFRETSSLTELDVSNFDTTGVTDMREMFRGMSSLITLDLAHFDTGNVINMNHMFIGMSALTELILGDLFTPIGSPGIPRLN